MNGDEPVRARLSHRAAPGAREGARCAPAEASGREGAAGGNVRGRRIQTLRAPRHQSSPSIKNLVSMRPRWCLASICYPATTARVLTRSCGPESLQTLQNLQQPLYL